VCSVHKCRTTKRHACDSTLRIESVFVFLFVIKRTLNHLTVCRTISYTRVMWTSGLDYYCDDVVPCKTQRANSDLSMIVARPAKIAETYRNDTRVSVCATRHTFSLSSILLQRRIGHIDIRYRSLLTYDDGENARTCAAAVFNNRRHSVRSKRETTNNYK